MEGGWAGQVAPTVWIINLKNTSLQIFSEQGASLREKDCRAPAGWIIALSDCSPLNYCCLTLFQTVSLLLQLQKSLSPNVFNLNLSYCWHWLHSSFGWF